MDIIVDGVEMGESDVDKEMVSRIEAAAVHLKRGGLVVFPTETVYGLGAHAYDREAVLRIFRVKRRPLENPLIVHVSGIEMARRLAYVSHEAESLMARFWSGALTLLLPYREEAGVAEELLSGHKTIGVRRIGLRCPSHAVARELVTRSSVPIAAPSANISGRLSPTCVDHARTDLSYERGIVYLDGGSTSVGLESTIYEPATRCVWRVGAIEARRLHRDARVAAKEEGVTVSSGRSFRHYAPSKPLRINVETPDEDETYVGFGVSYPSKISLSARGDVDEAAHNLYSTLHRLDKDESCVKIAVAPIPSEGIGEAIHDRLMRAAHG